MADSFRHLDAAGPSVQIRVAAEFGQLAILRTVTEAISRYRGFTTDHVTDIQLAVDEVSAQLIAGAVPGQLLDCWFVTDHDCLLITLETTVLPVAVPDRAGFGWQVVERITDGVTIDEAERSPEQRRVSVHIVKRSGSGSGSNRFRTLRY